MNGEDRESQHGAGGSTRATAAERDRAAQRAERAPTPAEARAQAEAPTPRTFHGRRHGKALRPTQRAHLDEVLPRLVVPASPAGAPRVPLDLDALFPGLRSVWLEIGFGGGEHLHALVERHPDVGFIGCEPFVNGVAMLLGKVAGRLPGNLRIHPGDARDLVDRLPEGRLGRAYLLYPDPWPKARHRKRRYVCPESLAPLARALAPGAELRVATDIADYAEHAAEGAAATGLLAPVVAGPPEWFRPWDGWQPTRYEAKALRAGRPPHYLVFRRIPG